MIGPLDLEQLGFASGAHLLVNRAAPGGQLHVVGTDPALDVYPRAWCRSTGPGFAVDPAGGFQVERSDRAIMTSVGQRSRALATEATLRRPG